MAPVIAVRGSVVERTIDRERTPSVAFMGADRPGKLSCVGVGVINESTGTASIWGLAIPHCIIQSWRAMKVLEEIPVIEHGTLCACWYAAGRRFLDSDKRHLEHLVDIIGEEHFGTLRARVLEDAPGADELDEMIRLFREHEIHVNVHELRQEIEAGTIVITDEIQRLLDEHDADQRQRELDEAESKTPMEPAESLRVFFDDVGVQHLLLGPPIGAYGWDWGHREMDGLDEAVRYGALRFGHSEHLLCTERGPDANDFGEIAPPQVVNRQGTTFVFTEANYTDGKMVITTTITPINGEPTTDTYTLADLRELIGKLPKSSRRRIRWRR